MKVCNPSWDKCWDVTYTWARQKNVRFISQTKCVQQMNPSHNVSVSYPTMHHFVTEMCTFLLQNGALWDNGTDALWDLWDGSIKVQVNPWVWGIEGFYSFGTGDANMHGIMCHIIFVNQHWNGDVVILMKFHFSVQISIGLRIIMIISNEYTNHDWWRTMWGFSTLTRPLSAIGVVFLRSGN